MWRKTGEGMIWRNSAHPTSHRKIRTSNEDTKHLALPAQALCPEPLPAPPLGGTISFRLLTVFSFKGVDGQQLSHSRQPCTLLPGVHPSLAFLHTISGSSLVFQLVSFLPSTSASAALLNTCLSSLPVMQGTISFLKQLATTVNA